MRDPYEVLGVPKNASSEAIKAAFRRQAKKLHPDANKQDKKAAAKFAELNAAYEILGDENKRKAYDRGEIDAEGKPRFQGFHGFGAGAGPRDGQFADEGVFETFTFGPGGFQRSTGRGRGFAGIDDILRDVFGSMAGGGGGRRTGFAHEDFGAPPQGRDVTGSVTISLTEAAKGATRRVRLPNGKEVEAKIPPGLADGQTIRLKGQGLPGPDGSVGDALITVSVAPHPLFKRDGADLRLELPITLYEALLGAKVRVPTLDGAVELAIPRGTNSGRTFRLRGKGLPNKSGGTGDLYATVRIMLPERSDPEFEELMRKWRDTKPYDPRKDMV
ncbi:MAG TPA: J domain-containing protein [Xanthobacteraceae bacterium]|nr:J domain-containing protein [Xanthobacteraceae bacterium]